MLTQQTSALAYEKVKNLGVIERTKAVIKHVLSQFDSPITAYTIAKNSWYEVVVGDITTRRKISYHEVQRRLSILKRDEEIDEVCKLLDNDGQTRTAYKLV